MGSAQGEYILLGHIADWLKAGPLSPHQHQLVGKGKARRLGGDGIEEIDRVEELAPAGQAALLWAASET